MGFDVVTSNFLKNYIDKNSSGRLDIQVSPDGSSIMFNTGESTISLAINEWNGLTSAEKQKISKIIINGDGKLVLCNDGNYRPIPESQVANYSELKGKPSINGVELYGNKTAVELGFAKVATSGNYADLNGLPSIPTALSQLTNDSQFITNTVDNLINYYVKSDTYSKTEVNQILNDLSSLSYKFVDILPTSSVSTSTIYLVKDAGANSYLQWMYINNKWANIGSTQANLSNYYTKKEVNDLVNNKVSKQDGYGLSQENYTPEEKAKLATIENYTLPVATETVLGGVRVDGFTIKIDENGVISTVGSGGGLAPSNVKNLRAEATGNSITLFWEDPEDTIIGGQLVSTWKGTRILYKVNTYPKTPTDGRLVMDNTIRNQYASTGYMVTGLNIGVKYCFQLFPYSTDMDINTNDANRVEASTISPWKEMTVIIDKANSNPETALTYADDALTMAPGSPEWDKWFGIYPCLLKDGVEVGRLNPDNFAQFEDGTPANITGSGGDVVVCFPIMGLKFEDTTESLKISITNEPYNSNYTYYAYQNGENITDRFYLGCYQGYLGSYSGVVLDSSSMSNLGSCRVFIERKGNGYKLFGFYQYTLICAMYILKYKNLNSYKTIGYGNINASAPLVTGMGNTKGMNYGTPSSFGSVVKLFGVENLWGDLWDWLEGAYVDGRNTTLMVAPNRTNYVSVGSIPKGAIYMKYPQGTSLGGVVVKTGGASYNTYYCDQSTVTPYAGTYYMRVGGSHNEKAILGLFRMDFNSTSSSMSPATYTGCRIMYLPPA